MNYHLISTILKGKWAIDEEAALGYGPLISNILGSGIKVELDFDRDAARPQAVERTTNEYSWYNGWSKAPKGSIAIIPITGPLMKNDQFCGPTGMATMGKIIQEADLSENIDGIMLHIDSPGGTVDGTVALAEIVANTKKPVIAFADGLMASAAYWIGASSDEIIAADNRTAVGSVGVLMSFADLQPAYERLGVKFHAVAADPSSEKTRQWEDVRSGRYENFKKEVLNPLAEDFQAHIKKSRPGVKDEQLSGKVYFAQDVLGSMVDSIGNMEFALSRLNQLIDDNSKKTLNKTTNSNEMKKQFANVNKALGVKSLEASDEGVFLNEEQLEALDNALKPQSTEEKPKPEEKNPEQKEETPKPKQEKPKEENTADPKDARIAELEAQVKTLGGAPAVDHDTAKSNDSAVKTEGGDFAESLKTAREMKDYFKQS